MAVDSITIIRVYPMTELPNQLGTGPALPVVVTVTTPGAYDFTDFAVPAGVDVTLTLIAGGGGGAWSASGVAGGGGGGGGGAVTVLLSAAQWAAGGTFTVPVGGVAGTAPGENGDAGIAAELDATAIGIITVDPGIGGVSTAGTGGAGGAVNTIPGYTVTFSRAGSAGAARTGAAGGAGGFGGYPGGGSGGAGGTGGGAAPTAGQNGRAIITY